MWRHLQPGLCLIACALLAGLLSALLTDQRAQAQADESASISGTVWDDANADGLQQRSEPGRDLGVLIRVWPTNGERFIAETSPEVGGRWKVSVPPGSYFVTAEFPDETFPSPQGVGNDAAFDSDFSAIAVEAKAGITPEFDLAADGTIALDLGLRRNHSITTDMWFDDNGNGLREPEEGSGPTLAQVTSRLSDVASGQVFEPYRASNNTAYSGLLAGTYRMSVTLPDGYSASPVDRVADDTLDSDIDPATLDVVVVLDAASPNATITLGVLPAVPITTSLIVENTNQADMYVPHAQASRAPRVTYGGEQSQSVPAQAVVVVDTDVRGAYQFEIALAPGEGNALVSCTPSAQSITTVFDRDALVNRVQVRGEADRRDEVTCRFTTSPRRFGDVNCDGQWSILDAAIIAQHAVGTRPDHSSCPITPGAGLINLETGDTNDDQEINILDAYRVAECSVGRTNSLCP